MGCPTKRSSSPTRPAFSVWSRATSAARSPSRVCRQRAMRQRGEQTRYGWRPEPRAMVLDDEIGQSDARQVERLPPHGVLEAGERRLGRQVGTGERIALEQELVDRVLAKRAASSQSA